MFYLPCTARASVILVAATANHVALSMPFPKLAAIEAAVPEAQQLHANTYKPRWLLCGIQVWKATVWCSTALEFAIAYELLGPPYSELQNMRLVRTSDMPICTAVGLFILAGGALVQVASRMALGRYARLPILPISFTSSKPLHVPPSITESLARSKKKQPVLLPDDGTREAACSLRPDHELITDGPYAYVRHPIYSSFLFGGLGSAIFYTSVSSPLSILADAVKLTVSRLPYQLPPSADDIFSFCADIISRKVGIGVVLAALSIASLHLYGVARWEDEALRTRFGNQWKVYKWRVRHTILYIPRI